MGGQLNFQSFFCPLQFHLNVRQEINKKSWFSHHLNIGNDSIGSKLYMIYIAKQYELSGHDMT